VGTARIQQSLNKTLLNEVESSQGNRMKRAESWHRASIHLEQNAESRHNYALHSLGTTLPSGQSKLNKLQYIGSTCYQQPDYCCSGYIHFIKRFLPST